MGRAAAECNAPLLAKARHIYSIMQRQKARRIEKELDLSATLNVNNSSAQNGHGRAQT